MGIEEPELMPVGKTPRSQKKDYTEHKSKLYATSWVVVDKDKPVDESLGISLHPSKGHQLDFIVRMANGLNQEVPDAYDAPNNWFTVQVTPEYRPQINQLMNETPERMGIFLGAPLVPYLTQLQIVDQTPELEQITEQMGAKARIGPLSASKLFSEIRSDTGIWYSAYK